MTNDQCKHKDWRLVKTNKIQDFKVWECEMCRFRLKERTTGSHEVFVIKDAIKMLDKNQQDLDLELTL